MARKVYISSDMSVDERLIDVAEQDPEAALLWPWVLTVFDDWGRAEASPKRLKATIFPMIESVTWQTIGKALELFAQSGLIILYEVDGKPYMAIPSDKWFKYQTHIRSEKREKDGSRHPAPQEEKTTDETQQRASACECVQPSEDARNCIPSPSPSPSPSIDATTTALAREENVEPIVQQEPDPEMDILHAFMMITGKPSAYVKGEDYVEVGKIIDSGVPPDFAIQAMNQIADERKKHGKVSRLSYFTEAIIERWEAAMEIKKARKESGYRARDSGHSAADGTESLGDKISYGYYDQFPGLVKTVSDV